jgi:hypothetical protein
LWSCPAFLDERRNDAVGGIDIDDGVHVTAALVTGSRPVHDLRLHGVIEEQKVAAGHLPNGLPGPDRLRECGSRLGQQDGSSKSDHDASSLHLMPLFVFAQDGTVPVRPATSEVAACLFTLLTIRRGIRVRFRQDSDTRRR